MPQADGSKDCLPGPSYEFSEPGLSGVQQSGEPASQNPYIPCAPFDLPGPSRVQQSGEPASRDPFVSSGPFDLPPLPELNPDTDVSKSPCIYVQQSVLSYCRWHPHK